MILLVLQQIKHIIADRLEIGPLVELIRLRFHLIIRFLERQKIAKHVHDRFLRLSFVDVFNALLDPLDLGRLPEMHVVLQFQPESPSQHQKLTDQIGRNKRWK